MTIPTITRLRTQYERDQHLTKHALGSWTMLVIVAAAVLAVLS